MFLDSLVLEVFGPELRVYLVEIGFTFEFGFTLPMTVFLWDLPLSEC